MPDSKNKDGVVYTETMVYSPPQQYAAEAPYQVAIIELEDGCRTTVRITATSATEPARIGDRVTFVEEREGVAYYRRAS
ncbi:MAG: OB-fold domain-containing protein [Acidobacteriaceae bacterium]|nr:OB-fold domain-containing protein [Acidobacteriaceae bacterium]